MGIMAPPRAYASGDEELSRLSFVCKMDSKTLDNFLAMGGKRILIIATWIWWRYETIVIILYNYICKVSLLI